MRGDPNGSNSRSVYKAISNPTKSSRSGWTATAGEGLSDRRPTDEDDPFTLTAVRHPEAFRAVARAVVARTVSIALDQGIPAPGFDDLEAMTQEMEQVLRDGELFGISDWAKSTLLGWGTTMAIRRRASLAQTATPIVGDVILTRLVENCSGIGSPKWSKRRRSPASQSPF